jgi:hypothetical protein
MSLTENEMRRMKIWEKREMRPLAARSSLEDLRSMLLVAHDNFVATVDRVTPEKAYEPAGEERMSPADMLDHLTRTLLWQAEKLRSTMTGAPTVDGAFDDLFHGAQNRDLQGLRKSFDDAWQHVWVAAFALTQDAEGMPPHPWFGPMNAREWLVATARHFDSHRGQIEECSNS